MLDQFNNLALKCWHQFLASPYWHEYFQYVNNLTPHQITILTIVTAVLLALYVFKKFGVSVGIVLLVIYLLYYTVFYSNFFANWQNDKRAKDSRMQIYNAELQKK